MIIQAAARKRETGEIDELFLCDVLCFFGGSRSGHVDHYGYSSSKYDGDSVRGGELWEKFIETNKHYYPYYHEPKLLNAHKDDIGRYCAKIEHFVELGPGSVHAIETKSLPLIQNIKPITYTIIDANPSYAVEGIDFLRKKEPDIYSSFWVRDFFEEIPDLKENTLLFLAGTTISNIKADLRFTTPQARLENTLRFFASNLREQSYFLFTFDANEDEALIRRAYDHPALEELNVNFIELIKRDLPTKGLEASDFELSLEWTPEYRLLSINLAPKRTLSFEIAGHRFDLPKGEQLHATNCFKFSEKMVELAAIKAGFTVKAISAFEGSPMRLAFLGK